MNDDINLTPFHVAERLAPVPGETGTRDDWVRYHAAQALAAWTVFDRDVRFFVGHSTQGSRPEIGYLSALGVASTHAAVALDNPDGPPRELWALTPEAGALNGEWEEYVVERLDELGVNPADINGEYIAADFNSPSRAEEATR